MKWRTYNGWNVGAHAHCTARYNDLEVTAPPDANDLEVTHDNDLEVNAPPEAGGYLDVDDNDLEAGGYLDVQPESDDDDL